jgi:hypothetical protein
MLLVHTRIYPALGKEAEVTDLVTESVRQRQRQGGQVAVSRRIFSSEGPNLVVSWRHDDLAAADAARRARLADADFQAQVARVMSLSREPVRTALEDSVIPMAERPAEPPAIVQRAFFHPALGKQGQVQSILEEFVRAAQASGRPQLSLWQQIFGENGPTFTITNLYADLAELGRVRQERAAAIQELVAAVHELSRAPIAVRLREVLVPFPS